MTQNILIALRRLLIDDYSSLRKRLARRYGSADFASEVLHEAWLRLDSVASNGSALAVHNPKAYLYRVALNIAADQKRSERSWLGKAELDAIHRSAQDDLDPARVAEARSELEKLAVAINQLSARRRAVFIGARLECIPYKDIALRLGVTVRVVDRELKLALEHLSEVLNEKSMAQGRSDSSDPSEA